MRDIFAQSDLRSVFSSATFRLNFDAAVNVWTHIPVIAGPGRFVDLAAGHSGQVGRVEQVRLAAKSEASPFILG